MPKGHSYSTVNRLTPEKKEMHPVWRGVGLVFIIVIPIISVALALLLVGQNMEKHWLDFPVDLLVKGKDPLLLIKAILSIAFILVLYAIFTMITFLANRFFGPPTAGPYDVPNARFVKRKR